MQIEFDGKVNVLALTSFVLSLIALGNQFFNYARGAQVVLHAPETVVLRAVTYPGLKDKYFVVLEAPLTFTNTGAIGYNAIVSGEQVEFNLGDHMRLQTAFTHFVDVDDRKTTLSIPPEYRGAEQAGPKVVPAQGAITHWTTFNPKNMACPATDSPSCDPAVNSLPLSDAFLDKLKAMKRMELTFSAQIIGKTSKQLGSCWINGSQIDIATLKERGFFAVDCYPKSE